MNLFWKIFAFTFGITYASDIIFSLFYITKLSIGDWIDSAIVITLTVGLFLFSFRKKLLNIIFWRISFWVILILSIIQIVYAFIPISFLSSILTPEFRFTYLVNLPLPFKILAFFLGIVMMYVPALYAVFCVGYKKYTIVKEVKEDKNAPYSQLAIASLILGLSGFFFAGPLLTIPGLITGIMALRNIRKGAVKGIAFAWTGISIFIVQTVFMVVLLSGVAYFLMLPGVMDGPQDAVKHMSNAERQYYDTKLAKIKQNSTVDDVNELLGEPFDKPKDVIDGQYQYRCSEEFVPQCTVAVTITNHLVTNVFWMDYGRFYYNRAFTESDLTFDYDNYQLLVTLEPGWSEYVYSKQELTEFYPEGSAPLTFTRENGSGVLYVYQYDQTEAFDLRKEIAGIDKEIRPKFEDIKHYTQGEWQVYEFSGKQEKEFFHVTYLVNRSLFISAVYSVNGKRVPQAELDEAMKIIKTFETEEL